MATSFYHIVLRAGALTVALLLLFDSGLMTPVSRELSRDTQLYIANAVSMYASVEPNGLNQITAKLTSQKAELDKREAALKERELSINLNAGGANTQNFSTYILSAVLFILVVLIVLNYALDFARERGRLRPRNLTV